LTRARPFPDRFEMQLRSLPCFSPENSTQQRSIAAGAYLVGGGGKTVAANAMIASPSDFVTH